MAKRVVNGRDLRDQILGAMEMVKQNPQQIIMEAERAISAMEAGDRKTVLEGRLATLKERQRQGVLNDADVLVLISE